MDKFRKTSTGKEIVDLTDLEDDIPGQIDAILRGIGNTQIEIDAFSAIYVITALQFALSQPTYLQDDKPIYQIEQFGKGLTEAIARKHPELYKIVQSGWDGVELVRIAFANTRKHAELLKDIPTKIRELKDLARSMGIPKYSRMKKQELFDAITQAKITEATKG